MFCLKVYCVTILMGVTLLAPINAESPVIFCYVGTWANYRIGEGKFLIEDIDPNLCTHLVYGFAKLSANKIAAYDPYLDLVENWGLGAFKRFNSLKKKNKNLKTLIAIGGWNEGSAKYSNMASNQNTRAKFVESVIAFVSKHGFDGLDIDWEYPANRGGVPKDKENFVTLLKELRDEFAIKGFLLTIAASAGKNTIDTAYDIKAISKYVDYINVMAYDFHGSWETSTGLNAPLYKSDDEPKAMQFLNVDYAVQYWLDHGVPPSKLVLGIGLYGRSFTLKDAKKHGIYEATTGKGQAGPITREGGMLGYNEICKFIKNDGWIETWHDVYKVPYAYKNRQWVGYDNERSIKLKINYLEQNQLAGAMVWSLETDDFKGICGKGRYPLLTTINNSLGIVTVPPPPTQSTSTSTTTVPQPTSDNVCKNLTSGLVRDPNDCSNFYTCDEAGNATKKKCPSGTKFDSKIKACNFESLVTDC